MKAKKMGQQTSKQPDKKDRKGCVFALAEGENMSDTITTQDRNPSEPTYPFVWKYPYSNCA